MLRRLIRTLVFAFGMMGSGQAMAVTIDRTINLDFMGITSYPGGERSDIFFVGGFAPVSLTQGDTLNLTVNFVQDLIGMSGSEGGLVLNLGNATYNSNFRTLTTGIFSGGTGQPSAMFFYPRTGQAGVDVLPGIPGFSFTRVLMSIFFDRAVDYQTDSPTTITLNGNGGATLYTLGDLSITAVPLPAGLPLLAAGLGVLGFLGWRRKRDVASALPA